MSEFTPTPDFLDIDPETAAAAEASLRAYEPVKVPETASENVSKKNETYYRWTESAVIEKAYREGSKNVDILTPVVQVRFRVGSPNGGSRLWARHQLHLPTLAGTNSSGKNYEGMNNRSIAAITTLLRATGFLPESGTPSSKMLNFLFPMKNAPGVESPLKGKTVLVNMVNSPNSGATEEKYKRQTNAESYLTDTPEE